MQAHITTRLRDIIKATDDIKRGSPVIYLLSVLNIISLKNLFPVFNL